MYDDLNYIIDFTLFLLVIPNFFIFLINNENTSFII